MGRFGGLGMENVEGLVEGGGHGHSSLGLGGQTSLVMGRVVELVEVWAF